MKLLKTALILPIIAMTTLQPAAAGSPENPGEKGQLVNHDKAEWQNAKGDKNAWGETVSGVAKGDNPNEDRSLGKYLDFMAGGPNPFNDNGGGNN